MRSAAVSSVSRIASAIFAGSASISAALAYWMTR
jgi:hypothetical protein